MKAQLGELARRTTIRLAKASLPRVYRDSPVPLDKVLRLRKFGGRAEIMTLPGTVHTGRALRNGFLAHRLASTVLGEWTAAAPTLNLLESWIHDRRPTLVLEFGSGVSTVCLAQYMCEVHGRARQTFVVSVEEDARCCADAQATTASLGLSNHVSIVHAPLEWQVIAGRKTLCYRLPDKLRLLLKDLRPDLVFIDGPAPNADALTRFGTVPLCRQLVAAGSSFYLDDALRDRELEVGRLWSMAPGISVEGVYFVGHGLLAGRMDESGYRPSTKADEPLSRTKSGRVIRPASE